jgi:hypothetical protein
MQRLWKRGWQNGPEAKFLRAHIPRNPRLWSRGRAYWSYRIRIDQASARNKRSHA